VRLLSPARPAAAAAAAAIVVIVIDADANQCRLRELLTRNKGQAHCQLRPV